MNSIMINSEVCEWVYKNFLNIIMYGHRCMPYKLFTYSQSILSICYIMVTKVTFSADINYLKASMDQ